MPQTSGTQQVILGLGSNLGDRLAHLTEAVRALAMLDRITILKVSPIYRSQAQLLPNSLVSWQSDFLNLAVLITTTLNPDQLLTHLQRLETTAGRPLAHQRWAPRTLDIDILLWQNLVIGYQLPDENDKKTVNKNLGIDYAHPQQSPHARQLIIPHPRLLERAFALWPAADLAPAWQYPLTVSMPLFKHTLPVESANAATPRQHYSLADLAAQLFGADRWHGTAPLDVQRTLLRAEPPAIMGIINLTPDSFSDGGQFDCPDSVSSVASSVSGAPGVSNAADQHSHLDRQRVISCIQALCQGGATIIDVGAEATNPHATPIDARTEWQRLQPFLQLWCELQPQWNSANDNHERSGPNNPAQPPLPLLFKPALSIDSFHPETLLKLLDYPIDFYNCVLDIEDELWVHLARAKPRAKFILMHNLGLPSQQRQFSYSQRSIVEELIIWGQQMKQRAQRLQISLDRLVLDVGIGFGKTVEQNWQILQQLPRLKAAWQLPLLVGHSRKSLLTKFTAAVPRERDFETALLSGWLATTRSVDYLRVHQPDVSVRAIMLQQWCQEADRYVHNLFTTDRHPQSN